MEEQWGRRKPSGAQMGVLGFIWLFPAACTTGSLTLHQGPLLPSPAFPVQGQPYWEEWTEARR